jgi:hypothetical protein
VESLDGRLRTDQATSPVTDPLGPGCGRPDGRVRAVDSRIGENISKFRRAAGISVTSLAGQLNVSEADIIGWEIGTRRVPAHLFLACAEKIAASPQQLVAGVPDIVDGQDS